MRVVLSLAALLVMASLGAANDLAKIDRTIRVHPILQSSTPRYCLLVLGEKAQTRVWVIVDDKRLYIDRNANGDLTEAGEMVTSEYGSFNVGQLTEVDGTTTHTNLRIGGGSPRASINVKLHNRLDQRVFRDARGWLEFSGDPKTAPIVHLNGPITLDKFFGQQSLTSTSSKRISAVVGTPGEGAGTFAMYTCSCFLDGGKAPEASIEFPHRDSDKPPLRVQVRLDRD